MKFGIISLNEYDVIRKTTNPPTSWSNYIAGDGIIIVEPTLANKILKNPEIKVSVTDTGFLFEEKIATLKFELLVIVYLICNNIINNSSPSKNTK